jgi:hypothetical protein
MEMSETKDPTILYMTKEQYNPKTGFGLCLHGKFDVLVAHNGRIICGEKWKKYIGGIILRWLKAKINLIGKKKWNH